MTTIDQDADVIVAREIYSLAVQQAREKVLLEVFVIAMFTILGAFARFPRQWFFTVSLLSTGVVATAYDIRWWLWLRRADPVDAYRRLQARPEREGGRFASNIALSLMVAGLILRFALPR